MLLHIVIIACLLIGSEPTVNFVNQRNLQISLLCASYIWLICRLRVRLSAAHDFQEQGQIVFRKTVFVITFFKTKHNKTIVIGGWGFCDIRNNQGYRPIFPDITKTSFNNYLIPCVPVIVESINRKHVVLV